MGSTRVNQIAWLSVDKISPARRSENMRRIRSSDTNPEIVLRSALFKLGRRFRKNVRGLPGRPDIVFTKARVAVFVHGCFWHLHDSQRCPLRHTPKSNIRYWNRKFRTNTLRDSKNSLKLRSQGWRVVTVWECKIRKALPGVVRRVEQLLTERESVRTRH